MTAERKGKTGKAQQMLAFLKSELFMKFAGGFVLGTVGVLFLHPSDSAPPANAETVASHAASGVDAAL